MRSDSTRKVRYILAAGGAICFMGMVLLLILLPRKNDSTPPVKRIADSIQHFQKEDETLHVVNTFGFADISLKNDTIKQYPALNVGSTITNIRWYNNAAFFKSSPVQSPDSDTLAIMATQYGADPATPHWWKYIPQKDAYTIIPPALADRCVDLLPIADTRFACVRISNDMISSSIHILEFEGGTDEEVVSSKYTVSKLFYEKKTDVLYYTERRLSGADSFAFYSFKDKKYKVFYESSYKIPSITAAGSVVVALEAQPKGGGYGSKTTTDPPADTQYHSFTGEAYDKQNAIVFIGHKKKYIQTIGKTIATISSEGDEVILTNAAGEAYTLNQASAKKIHNSYSSEFLMGGTVLISNNTRYVINDGILYKL